MFATRTDLAARHLLFISCGMCGVDVVTKFPPLVFNILIATMLHTPCEAGYVVDCGPLWQVQALGEKRLSRKIDGVKFCRCAQSPVAPDAAV